MSSTSTSWTTQGNTKAGATSSSTDSLTTGTLTANTIQLASNIIKASDGGSTITLDTSDNVTIAGGLTIGGTANLDAVDIDGNVQLDGTFTVGVDGTGKDVKFFGDDPGNFMLWDQSEDRLEIRNDYARAGLLLSNTLSGDANNSPAIDYYRNNSSPANNDVLGITTYKGRNNNSQDVIYARLQSSIIDITDGGEDGRFKIGVTSIVGDLDVDGTANLDAVDIDGNVQLDGTFTIGVDDAGHDVIFYGNTASHNMMWDASQNDLEFTDNVEAKWGTGADFRIGHDGTDTELTNDEGKLIIENEAAASIEIKCDSGQTIELGHATSTVEIKDNLQINDGLIFNAAAQITCLDNNSAALQIGSSGKLDLVTIGTTNTQETVIIDADRTSGAAANLGALKLVATAGITGDTTDSNMGGLYLGGPTFVTSDGGTHTTTRHNYIKVDDANFTNTSGSSTVTDVCLFEFENNLNTSGSCTTNSDKTGEAKSGTIKVNVNGTKYHIQLYAD